MDHAPLGLFRHWDQIFLHNYEGQLTQYVAIAGVAFLVFYWLGRRIFLSRKIQPSFPPQSDLRREIYYSLLSIGIFASVGFLVVVLQRLGWGHMYQHINEHGWPYLIFSAVLLIFLHDTWFYWTHRLLHWRPLFKLAHRIHHLSHNPSPWAAFAFHPLEAFIEAMVYPLVILVVPIHPLAALIWLLYMTVMNVLGHLGFEVLPAGFARHGLFRWHNTGVHHNMHHHYVHYNYGLYFNIWDRLMGTNHPEYEDHYDKVTGKAPAISPDSSHARQEVSKEGGIYR